MSKRKTIPTTPRLVRLGGAKRCTNAVKSPINPEDAPNLGFGE